MQARGYCYGCMLYISYNVVIINVTDWFTGIVFVTITFHMKNTIMAMSITCKTVVVFCRVTQSGLMLMGFERLIH